MLTQHNSHLHKAALPQHDSHLHFTAQGEQTAEPAALNQHVRGLADVLSAMSVA
jgi:hypothetical protein